MKSFGVWYKLTDEPQIIPDGDEVNNKQENISNVEESSTNEENSTNQEKSIGNGKKDDKKSSENNKDGLAFDLHMNLWSKMRSKNNMDKEKTFLDVGFKIKNYDKLDNLVFVCPFEVKDNEIIDLSGKMTEKRNANLIFNNECEIETNGSYTIINDNEKDERILVYPLKQSVDDVLSIENVCEENYKIQINFEKFKRYIEDKSVNKNISSLKDIKTIYFRFRIKSEKLYDELFSNIEPINKYFESGFISTQIVDFKINKRRNINENILAKAIINKKQLVKFSNIHFLLMEPAHNDVIDISNDMSSCRKLETEIWDNYLDLDTNNSNILVYHWKESEKSNENGSISEFGKLVKINYSKTNSRIILYYIASVILLGALGSIIANSVVKLLFPSPTNPIVIIDIVMIGIPSIIICVCLLRIVIKLIKKTLMKNKNKK